MGLYFGKRLHYPVNLLFFCCLIITRQLGGGGERGGGNETFHANKEAKHSNKSSRFVNLYKFYLKCYGIKLNPMHGCSRRSCRDISVELMMVHTLPDRSWETLPPVLFS